MNGKAHRFAGVISGGGAAFFASRGQTNLEVIVESMAGIAAGALGAKFPDWAEPATSSWHRGPVHSVGTGIWSLGIGIAGIMELQSFCDQRIANLRYCRALAQTPEAIQWYTLEIFFWLAVVASLKGLLAGYLSHLALDATTPRSVPLF